jgi:hypothetical protein
MEWWSRLMGVSWRLLDEQEGHADLPFLLVVDQPSSAFHPAHPQPAVPAGLSAGRAHGRKPLGSRCS